YTGTEVEHKVEQLFGDSKTLDITPWAGTCDLVFVDGSHAYSYVVSDSEKALQLVRPGGLVLWHDYAGPRHSAGVYRGLKALALQVYFKAGIVTSFTHAPVKLGFDRARARDLNWLFTTDRVPAREGQHVQDQYFEFLDTLGISHEPVAWDLGPWDHERPWQHD